LPKPRHRTKQPNAMDFDTRPLLHRLLGTDGIGPYLALRLISECGTDLGRWPTAKHFTSWLSLAPGCKVSGGKVLSSRTRRSASAWSRRQVFLRKATAWFVGKDGKTSRRPSGL